ncbi:MAG: response regulator [Myxococcales bacterium]|nr:response regulator [Myxococcales bacterium]
MTDHDHGAPTADGLRAVTPGLSPPEPSSSESAASPLTIEPTESKMRADETGPALPMTRRPGGPRRDSEASMLIDRGSEVLLIDRDERVRDGFRKLLSASGVVVTAIDDADRAVELVGEKYFAVAVVDIDTPGPEAGLTLMQRIRERSPQTTCVALSARQTFDLAVRGFRAGAADVIAKAPENVGYLTQRVTRLCGEHSEDIAAEDLLGEVLEVHEAFLKRLMEQSRKAAVATERAAGREPDADLERCTILVVDDNPRNAPGLQNALGTEGGYHVVAALTGGEALDFVGQSQFQIALVKKGLPDLPSNMIINGLKAEAPEGIVMLFQPPSDEGPGRVDIIETSGPIELVGELTSGRQLVERIAEVREAYVAKVRERRYLRAFREQHFDFLRKYVELKRKITELMPDE